MTRIKQLYLDLSEEYSIITLHLLSMILANYKEEHVLTFMTTDNINIQYEPSDIANFFLSVDDFKTITVMKLIKLVYFGYAWSYALLDRKIFEEKIEKWQYGPVVPSIYHEFKRFGHKNIQSFATNYSMEDSEAEIKTIHETDKDVVKVLNFIWKIYKDKTGKELSDITHREGSPWNQVADRGEPLRDEDMKKAVIEAYTKYFKA